MTSLSMVMVATKFFPVSFMLANLVLNSAESADMAMCYSQCLGNHEAMKSALCEECIRLPMRFGRSAARDTTTTAPPPRPRQSVKIKDNKLKDRKDRLLSIYLWSQFKDFWKKHGLEQIKRQDEILNVSDR